MKIEVDKEKLDIVLGLPVNRCISLFYTINGTYCGEQCLHCPFLTESTLIRWLKEDK